MTDIRTLARLLGGVVIGRDTVLAPGPGHSPKDRSLSVRISADAPGGFVVHSHAGTDWRTCREYVRAKFGMPPWEPGDEQDRRIHPVRVRALDRAAVDAEAEERRPRTEDDLVRIKRANKIWNGACDPRGTLAERYLRQHRKLDLPDALVGHVLRFHPRCPWRNEDTGETEFVPALIAVFRSLDDDSITAVHRIALRPDASKIDRRMLGVVQRSAIKLEPATDQLCIGEGVETCMAAQQLGYRPAWALGTVGAISFFPLLDGVKGLHILGETGEASARAIQMCGTRWHRARRRVRIIRPDPGCSDLNDELMARCAS